MADPIKSWEITEEKDYSNRRTFLRSGILAGTAATTVWLYRRLASPAGAGKERDEPPASGYLTPEGEPATDLYDITHYNNFYEFSTSKERVYRFRCVEAWSMVIPWLGVPLARLLSLVEPMASARFVAFETKFDPTQMPNQRTGVLPWPYVEGLRLDEALHPLTLLSTGLYGKALLPQNGAPIRLVVPWKYGFKSIKSVVRLRLVAEQPPTTWSTVAPDEYGFYSNVHPGVPHPRWSQARERRIGNWGMRETQLFNGYAEEVASLYTGMDLKQNY